MLSSHDTTPLGLDTVTVLRRLLRRRLALAVGLVVMVVVATTLTYRVGLSVPPKLESRQYQIGVASASVLFDTQKSQVSDIGDPKVVVGPEGLAARSRLLANLIAASPVKEQIAARAQVPSQHLFTKLASSDPTEPIASPATIGVTIRETDPAANVLTLTLNDQVPIITFAAQAPSAAAAARLSDAAVVELQRYLGRTSSANAVPTFRRLVAEPLGAARSSTDTRGPTRKSALVAALLVFALWCAAIIATEGLVRRWRQTSGDDVGEAASPGAPEPVGWIGAPDEIAGPRREGHAV